MINYSSNVLSEPSRTYFINILYQNIIKPYMFVQQQYDQLRKF